MKILAKSSIGVHLAVSSDLFRIVFFQGHPEYDTISLLKEYKRDVALYLEHKELSYPPMPRQLLVYAKPGYIKRIPCQSLTPEKCQLKTSLNHLFQQLLTILGMIVQMPLLITGSVAFIK